VHLQRVTEQHEHDDRRLPEGDEERSGGVHRDDVRADGGPEGEVPEDGDDFVCERRAADGVMCAWGVLCSSLKMGKSFGARVSMYMSRR
jgi:hypothetical protein